MEKRGGHEVPLLAGELMAMDICGDRESQFLKGMVPGELIMFQWLARYQRVCGQHKLDSTGVRLPVRWFCFGEYTKLDG